MLARIVLRAFRDPHGREPRLKHAHLIAAPPKTVPAVDHHDVKGLKAIVSDAINETGEIPRRAVHLASIRSSRIRHGLRLETAHALSEDPNAPVDTLP